MSWSGKLMEERMIVDSPEEAEEVLDELGLDYDWDDGGRLMAYSDDVEDIVNALEERGIEVDVI